MKRKIVFFAFILIIIGIAGKFYFSYLIEKKINDVLLNNSLAKYTIKIETIQSSLFQRSITLNELSLLPKEESLQALKSGEDSINVLQKVHIGTAKIKGIGLTDFILNKNIEINNLLFSDLDIYQYENSKIKKLSTKNKSLDIDAIELKNINELLIKQINFDQVKFQIFDFSTNQLKFKMKPLSFISTGIKLEKNKSGYFSLKPSESLFKINNIDLNFIEAKYKVLVDAIQFDFNKNTVKLNKISLKPELDLQQFADNYDVSKSFLEFDIDTFAIYNFNIKKLVKGDGLHIDSISLSKFNLKLYKDKNKPEEYLKTKELPHTLLKKMEFPLQIKKVQISNSQILIQEKLKDKDLLLEIPINDIYGKITNISSLETDSNQSMVVGLNVILMHTSSTEVNFNFPLQRDISTFYMNGSMGPAEMHYFDTALFPVIGLKLLQGKLDKINFSATANDNVALGKMTFLYHDLKAVVYKSHSLDKNNFMSWSVNTLIHKSNPNNNGHIREVVMEFERDKYKGLGNYFWKTIETGLVNTFKPGGKQIKASKHKKKEQK
jgi:hypothetical protein